MINCITKDKISALPDLWDTLKCANKPIVLYGMGDGADKIINELNARKIPLCGVFASDDFVRGQKFHDFTVKKYSDMLHEYGDIIVLVSFGTHLEEIISRIKDIAKKSETYSPDVAVIGGNIFDKEYALSRYYDIITVYNMLCDEVSQNTFNCLIKYKITGKIEYLSDCENSTEPLVFTENETFLDLGAYTGDTVTDFITRANSKYNSITAVEPDVKTFNKLCKNTAEYKNTNCLNICIGEKSGTAVFAMRAGRNSSLSQNGREIAMDCVDNIMQNGATYIKMDVEGQESAAIIGAENTIAKYKPKMKIATYHRYNDILQLPLQVTKICGDYKIYLRHKPHIPAWDTDYYFI